MTAETSEVTGPPVAGAERLDLKLRLGIFFPASSVVDSSLSIEGVNASANDPPAAMVVPELPEDEPVEPPDPPEDDPEDEETAELPELVDESDDEPVSEDDEPLELPDDPEELPEEPDDEDPPEDELPELPPDEPEGGVAGGAGGGSTFVSVTSGSEEDPAVVGTDPYSKAPMSQKLPRSKLLKSVVVTPSTTTPLLIAGLELVRETSWSAPV